MSTIQRGQDRADAASLGTPEVQQLQAWLKTPQAQQLIAGMQGQGSLMGSLHGASAFSRAMEAAGVKVPKGWNITQRGTLERDPNTALTAAMIMGGTALGAYALPAILGGSAAGAPAAAGAAPSAAAGGTAAGTTAAGTTAASTAGGSLLSKLGKVAPLIQDASQVASGISAGRAAGRAAEATQEQSAARDEQGAYSNAVRQSILASLLGGMQDVNISSPSDIPRGEVTGGLRPSAFKGREDLSELIGNNAKIRLNKPPDTNYDTLGGEPSKLDSALNIFGGVGSMFGAAAPYLRSSQPPTLPDAPNVAGVNIPQMTGQPRNGAPSFGATPDFGTPQSNLADPRYRVPGAFRGVRF